MSNMILGIVLVAINILVAVAYGFQAASIIGIAAGSILFGFGLFDHD